MAEPRKDHFAIAGAGFGLFLWLCAPAAAADLTATVPGHKGLTYFDLMRRVVPDLRLSGKGDATGHKTVPLQHIEGKDSKIVLPETITLSYVEAMSIPGDDSRIVLLADLGQSEESAASASVLALFTLKSGVKLLDTKEVGTDRFTGFRAGQPQMLAKATPLILIDSSHFNSDQNYNSTEMIFIRDNRFRLIDSVFTFRDSSCSYTRTQEPRFTLRPAPNPYSAVDVVVTEHVELTKLDCGNEEPPPAKDTTYAATYRWDAAQQRFVTSSKALQELFEEDRKRF